MLARNYLAALALAAMVLVPVVSASLAAASGGPGSSMIRNGSVRAGGVGATLRLAAGSSSDTWQSYRAPAGFPGLFNPGVASGPIGGSLVVFGGCEQLDCAVGTNATWSESNGVWAELHPIISPAPREEAEMAWDPADGYVLLFGGTGCQDPPACDQTGPLNDTWAFKDGTWNRAISSGPGPPPTDLGGLAYDPSDRMMVLFGGSACSTSCKTWTYSGGTWTELNLTTQPPARYGEGFAEDQTDHGALLFGGMTFSGGGQVLNDSWLFSYGTWHQENGSSSPPGRWDPAMAWDPGLDAVVLFGGRAGGNAPSTFNDTWQFQAGAWTQWGGTAAPGPSWETGFAQDPTSGILILVGSCQLPNCPSNTSWGFGPQHAVSVTSEMATCANFTLAGTPLSSGAAAELQNGTYPLRIVACSGFQLANLTASALVVLNVTAENVTAWTGSILVHGAGDILVNLTRVVSNPPPSGLAAISILGLTFLELLLILVALAAVVGIFVALQRVSRRRARPPEMGGAGPTPDSTPPARSESGPPPPKP
ncbi:MAG: hypothetical protein WB789_00285 [Thermoplasmata archaeon]